MVCGGIGGLLDVRGGVECAKFLLFFRFFCLCVVCGNHEGSLSGKGCELSHG